MVENLLTEALRELVREAVKDLRLPVKDEAPRAPEIINGYLPPRKPGVKDDFPFVVVRAENGSIDREKTEFTVSFIIGCCSNECDGYEYCMNVMSRIRNALTTMENGIVANRYILQFPITWDIHPEQAYPQWQLDMTTKWIYRTPQNKFES